jgi:hypothetical protein
MREGAFALIDCLGFKGIWKRTGPAVLVQKLLGIEQTVSEQIASAQRVFSFIPVNPRVSFLSDTVAISLQFEEQESETFTERQRNYLVHLICFVVIGVLDLFLKGEPPLVLRGCISYGEHLSEGNFIAGPAVDDAAEYMNIAEGAFIWLHPSAAVRYRAFVDDVPNVINNVDEVSFDELLALIQEIKPQAAAELAQIIENAGHEHVREMLLASFVIFAIKMPVVIDEYKMPLKAGAVLQCPVLNPLAHLISAQDRRAIIDTYSKVIAGNRLDLWLKHQHTIDFLETADRVCTSFSETFNNSLKSLAEKFDN